MTIESYLIGNLGCERDVCSNPDCREAVKERPDTRRFYITMGHPGFNSRANNGNGYDTSAAARAAIRRYYRTKMIRICCGRYD